MKWIGQHIVDLIARFRGDVYLEDIDTGTIASGSHLGLDSNNKIVKAVDGGGDITGVALTAASGIDLTSVSGATGGAYAATVGVDVSDFMTNGTDNYVLTATGADAMNAEANLTFSGTKLSATTSSSPGFLIDHTSSTNSAYGLKLNQGPPGLGISVDHNETRTAGIGGRGLNVDYDKTAVLADGQTGIYNGTNVNLYDQVTNHSGSTFTQTGHYTSIIATGSTGAMTNIGYDASIGNLAGGGTNIGFQSNAFTEGGIDFYSIGETALYATNSTDDYFKIVTAVNGATTLTTRDAAAAAAHFEIEAGGDITLDSAGQIKLEPVAGNNILLDGTIAIDAGVVTGATSITSTAFVGDVTGDASGSSGSCTGQAATVATIAGLAPNTATTQASQPNITGVGTIGTGVWEGTAVATDQQKHLAWFTVKGFGTGDGTNYDMPAVLDDDDAPWKHSVSAGSAGTTAIGNSNIARMGGIVAPRAGTLKRWTGWATTAGSSTANIALFKITPTRNDNSDVAPVLLDNVAYTALGNTKMEDFDETSFTDADIAAGDIIVSGINCQNNKTTYFASTLEIEWD